VASAKPKVLPQPSKVTPSTQQRRQNNSNAYTLGPGDRVRIDVFNVPEYSGEFVVLVDGTLNLPLVGAIQVTNFTLNRAAKDIEQAYKGFVRVPSVTIGLLLARPIQVTIAGEVNRAGSYNIPLSETRKFPTLSQAVQLAGGVNQTSNLRRVRVTRGTRVGYFDLLAVLQNADPTQDLTLRDGDSVFVPTATNINASDIARISDSNIGSQDAAIKIVVIGEVSKPGTYSMKAEFSGNAGANSNGRLSLPTLTEALRLAGGSTASADASRIVVQRLTRNGPPQRISVNLLRLLNAGDTSQDLPLQNGDTIYLPTDPVIGSAGSRQLAASSFGPQVLNPIKIAVVGQVNRPGTYNVKGESNASGSATIQNVNFSAPTVTQAIQSAGGIKPTADVRRIKLLRFNRDGRGQAKTVNLWALLTQGDSSQDLALQEGDRIIIPEIPAGTINAAETDILANAPFAPGIIRVNVVGELKGVRQNGATIELPPTSTLNQAILAAGGFDPVRANKNSVDLIRLNPNGSVTKRTIGVDFAKGVDETINPTLRNNDIVVIGRSGTTRVGDGLGSILNPLSPLFSIFNLFRR
jgi:polysaccharide biosynthesis/export protein